MNKKLLTSLVGASLLGASAIALADGPTVSGNLHVSFDRFDNDSTATAEGQEQGFISSNFSYVNVAGDHDLGGGMKGIYQVRVPLRIDNGASGLGGTLYDTFVGIKGAFGTFRAGRIDSPVKEITGVFNKFGTRVGDSRNLNGQGGTMSTGFDNRFSNVVRYDSPNFAGVSFAGLHSSGENTTTHDANAVNVRYNGGPASVGLGYEKIGTNTTEDESIIRLTGGFKFGSGEVYGLYEKMADLGGTSGADRDAFGIGGAFKFGSTKVMGHYVQLDAVDNVAVDNGAKLVTVGVDHSLSKMMTVYVLYAQVKNDDAGAFKTAGAGAHGDSFSVVAGQDQKAVSGGVIVKF